MTKVYQGRSVWRQDLGGIHAPLVEFCDQSLMIELLFLQKRLRCIQFLWLGRTSEGRRKARWICRIVSLPTSLRSRSAKSIDWPATNLLLSNCSACGATVVELRFGHDDTISGGLNRSMMGAVTVFIWVT